MKPEDRQLLSNRDDLPDEVKSQLCSVNSREWIRVQIVEVLRVYGTLNIDEIIVALWRNHQRVTTRKTVYNRIQELSQAGEIKRAKLGYYQLPGEAA